MSERATTAMPVPTAGSERPGLVIVFGGTFDPPHRGHVELPARVREAIEKKENRTGTAWLVYVPAARSPHKTDAPVASDADRLEMLRLAIGDAHLAQAGVWTDELDRAPDQPSYTVDTLTRARDWLDANGMSGTALRLLIGADQALGFCRWRQPRQILALAKPVVMVRDETADADELVRRLRATGFWDDRELEMWKSAVVQAGTLDISATRLRQALAAGDARKGDQWLTPSVSAYIRSKHLYGAPRA